MDLNELRTEINEIDEEILKLFLRRMEVAGQVADYKRENNLPIYQPQREQEILESVAQRAGELGGYAGELFTTLMDLSKQYQRDQEVTA
jgi:chorismate mutase/prephenate dehydratase